MKQKVKYIRYFLIVLVPIVVAHFSIWYWSLDHQDLVVWYKDLNPNFYRSTDWGNTFFTPTVKSQGNWWCLVTLLATFIWAYIVWQYPCPKISKLKTTRKSVMIYGAIAIFAVIMSIIANAHSVYGTDEIFSALNFASIPLFQSASYYALPNNHILFNFINRLLFFWRDNLVYTGRIISLICYAITLCASWYFLKKFIKSYWITGGSLIIIALAFPVWGFSGQARGYEMLLLFSVLSLISFWEYWVENRKDRLLLYSVCNVGGILTIPTYLYWWVGLLLAALLFMVLNKKIDKAFIKTSLLSFIITLILSLPFLTFSGISAMSESRWIRHEDVDSLTFLFQLNKTHYFNGLFGEWFCFLSPNVLYGLVLVLFPFILIILLKKDKRFRYFIISYFTLLIAFVLIAVLMRKLPFYRNMIAHSYLVILFILITLSVLFSTRILKMFLGVLILMAIPFFTYYNFKRIPEDLYYYGVTSYYNKLYGSKTEIKQNSTVYLDDESFFWWYVVRTKYIDKGVRIDYNNFRFNNQDYCIVPINSSIPEDSSKYKLVEVCDDFNIFERQSIQSK